MNEDLLYADHNSWCYFVVDDTEIVKCGETSLPLGIKTVKGKHAGQPLIGTKSRLGRYRRNGGTDEYIRKQLCSSVKNGTVSFWAKQCDIIEQKILLANSIISVYNTLHIDLERQYLNHFVHTFGRLPRLNKMKK